MSANVDLQDEVSCRVTKPFTPDELRKVIEEALNSEAAPNLPNGPPESLPFER